MNDRPPTRPPSVPAPNVPLWPARNPEPAGLPDTVFPNVEDEGRGGVQPMPPGSIPGGGSPKLPNSE